MSEQLTRKDLEQVVKASEERVVEHVVRRIDRAQEELARMVASGFEDIHTRLDVTERVQRLEADMRQIKQALQLTA